MKNDFNILFKIIRWEIYITVFLFLYIEYPSFLENIIWSLF